MRKTRTTAVIAITTVCSALLCSGCQESLSDRPFVAEERVKEIRSNLASGDAAGGGASAVEQDPTGWVTLTGSFKFAAADIGKIAKPSPLEISGGDAAVCRQAGVPMSETVVVGPDGGLKNVVIYVADDLTKKSNADKWVHPSASGATEPVIFDQKGCVFLTHVVAMQVTQPLEILNSDSVGHNTALATTPFNKIIPPGGKEVYQHREEKRAPYNAKCSIHPWMSAYILARNNGYFAVTKEDGSFTIENMPAGVDLTLKIWHEKVGLLKSVTINGAATTLSSRGYKTSFEPGEEKFDVIVDAGPFAD